MFTIDELKQKNVDKMDSQCCVFDESYRMGNGLTEEKKNEIREAVGKGVAYIR